MGADDFELSDNIMNINTQVKLILDACPIACLVFDEQLEAVDCNSITVALSGAASKAELLKDYQKYFPVQQPNGEKSIEMLQQYMTAAVTSGEQQQTEWLFELPSGQIIPCKATISKVQWEDTFRIFMFAEDLSELTEEMKRIQDAENRSQLIMDNTLLITSLWNSRGEMVDCSMYALKVFGLENKEEYMEHFFELNPEYQPDGMSTEEATQYHINKAFTEGYDKFDWMYLTAKGDNLPVETTLIRVWWNNEFHILAHSIDKRELENTSAKLAYHEKLLRAVNESAKILLENNEKQNNDSIIQALQIIGDCVEASSIGIWKNNNSEDDAVPDSERLAFWSIGVKADFLEAVILPINLDGEFWGYARFSFLDTGHVLSDEEKDILQSANLMIASAIIRQETNRKLMEATARAIESVCAKNEFLARMSHEIRTPINAIIGMTTIARKTDDEEKVINCLDTITSSSQQLLALVNDVLDMSKMDLGKMEIVNEAFDFEIMLSTVLEMLRDKIEEKNLKFRYEFETLQKRYIISDEKRLMQVIVNLMTNAIKFTPVGGEIILSVKWWTNASGKTTLKIAVIDNGIGISANALPSIFNPFEQGDGGITRKYGGTGLGLAISKNIITLMRGTIRAVSQLNEGSTFTVEIPIVWGDSTKISDKMSAFLQPIPILLVENNAEDKQYFSHVLQDLSQVCDCAANGREAVHKVQEAKQPYHIAYVTIDLVKESGVAIAEKICELSPTTQIILLSSVSTLYLAEKQKRVKKWSYIMKPLMPIPICQMLYNSLSPRMLEEKDVKKQAYDWHNRTILLVEDIAINREIIEALLEDSKVNIISAQHGQEALELFAANPTQYDFIFMDMQMPVMDGLTATRKIRELSVAEAKTVPIVAMTANAFQEDEEQCLAAGMTGYLSKPVDVVKMYEVLAAAFEG